MSAIQDVSVDGFLRRLIDQTIAAFVTAVTTDPELMAGLCEIDLLPDDIAAFAGRHGYAFSGNDLRRFIDKRLEAKLTPAECAARQRLLADIDSGAIPDPAQAPERETVPRLTEHRVTPGFVLDREEILSGGVTVLRQVPGLGALLARIAETLRRALDLDDLQDAHLHCDFQTLRARTTEAYETLCADDEIAPLVRDVVSGLGLDAHAVLWEWPGFRVLPPQRLGGHGVYRAGYTGSLGPHRDTWYGSPQHQLNLWGPICPIPPDATLRILPRHFQKRVANSSRGFDNWQNYAGLALPPGPRETIPVDDPIAPPLSVGDMICFAGQHLHASAPNMTERSRVSFEFRLLHRDDEGARYAPTNIDYYGIGEIYKGWHDADGKAVMRLSPQVAQAD